MSVKLKVKGSELYIHIKKLGVSL